ncbi:MAG: hypothetical protein PHS32_01415 [Rhodoferax sp.]|uniref:hypothetical protein n=1 Tax=Rhodoferax sp. TaxID=50421 RepID=UPI002610CFD5|nr:hypothetical protein [Rhodoferax sp.]MDD5332376.1 hypothetical protein [Rhodoferax sp.]
MTYHVAAAKAPLSSFQPVIFTSLLPFEAKDLKRVLPEVALDRRIVKAVTMARATMPDGQTLRAVNDLFIGPRSHTLPQLKPPMRR